MRLTASVLVMALLVACSGTTVTQTRAPTPTVGPTLRCEAAPAWLVTAIQGGITQGARLSEAFTAPATDLSGPPPIVESDSFKPAWWVVGHVTGTGIDEMAIWLTNSLDENDSGLILAANAAAEDYSDWGADVDLAIGGSGSTEVRDCLGST